MAYCRWSSDNFKCDLYCYEDCNGGFTTFVADNRIVGDIPELLPLSRISDKEWAEAYQKQTDFLETAKRKNIGLPYDGECFNDPTLEAFLKRILSLREIGYNFPDYVIEDIKKEQKEEER